MSTWLPGVVLAQTGSVFLDGQNLDYLTYNSGVLFWKAGCIPGVGTTSSIHRFPSGGGAISTYFDPGTCDGSRVRSQNIAVDAARRVYWATSDGRIVRLEASASPPTTPTTLATLANNTAPSVVVSVSRDYVYWAETFGEFRDSGVIYRAPIDGGARQVVVSLTSPTGGGAVALHAMGRLSAPAQEQILFQRAFGKLSRGVEQPVVPGQDPWTESTVINSIRTFTVANSRIYYAEASSGVPVAIRSRTLEGAPGTVTHATIDSAGSPDVTDLAVDGTAAYWRERRNNTGPIRRSPFSGGGTAIITENIAPAPGDSLWLVSDGRNLFWRQNPSEIYHLPVDAAAARVYDFACKSMEVVQTIQSRDNDVPLLAEKSTAVRVIGTVTAAAPLPMNTLTGFAQVQLHGTRDNEPLPGSPIQPSGGDGEIRDVPRERFVDGEGFWFRLPPSWTQESGNVVLRAEFNEEHVYNETDFTDNSQQVQVEFLQPQKLHLIIRAVRTNRGTVDNSEANRYRIQPIVEMVEALLPVSEVTYSSKGPVLEEFEGFGFGPYELSKSDNDSWGLLFKMLIRQNFSGDAIYYRHHPVAFFPPSADMAGAGFGFYGFNSALAAFDLNPTISGYNDPMAGVLLTHELMHNLDRSHVDCGVTEANPGARLDDDYPYPVCKLSDSSSSAPDYSADYYGWNPLVRRVVPGESTGDITSYSRIFSGSEYRPLGYMWTSDYTFRATFDDFRTIPNPPPPSFVAASSSPTAFLGAVLDAGGTARIFPAIAITDSAALASISDLMNNAPDQAMWSFLVRRANGSVLATLPAVSSNGPEGSVIFATMEDYPDAASIALVRTSTPGVVVASLSGGGQPPSLAITSPTGGNTVSGDLAVQWNASDPEGLPLVFQVRYSRDQGASWRMMAEEIRTNNFVIPAGELPGGPSGHAQVEVLASDGIRTTSARSAFFTVNPRPPQPFITTETERGRSCGSSPSIPAGESIIFRGSASDPEDEAVDSDSFVWLATGSTGIVRSGTGREFLLRGLPPANYNVELSATDSDGQVGSAVADFIVKPIAVSTAAAAPVLDGLGNDSAYQACLHPQYIRYSSGAAAAVRSVLFGTTLYISVSGLQVGDENESPGEFVGIAFDPNKSGETTAQAGDRRFVAKRDGEFFHTQGDGAGGFSANPQTAGFSVRIAGDAARWHAEFAIPLSTLGLSPGQLVGMDVGHFSKGFVGDDHHWLSATATAWNRPADWADTRLASDPDDPRDADFDGMADAWELEKFGTMALDGTDDTDGDGQNDRDEYFSGTDPRSVLSRFVGILVPEGASFRLTWPSATGRVYSLESSEDLRIFEPMDIEVLGTGAIMSYLIDGPFTESRLFLRVTGRPCP